MEAIRRIQYKVAANRANVHILPPYWGLVLADSVHPTGASYIAMAQAEAAHIAYVLGKVSLPNDGMSVSSAVVDELGILLNIDHDNGTDFTVPVFGEGVEAFQITEGSQVHNFDGFERVNANQLRLYTGASFGGDNIQIDTIYGSLYDLGQGEPPMVRDNSAYTLPFIDQVVNVTNPLRANDPILRLTNRAYYVRPTNGKTMTSGNEFSSIASVDGTKFTATNDDWELVPSAFDGVGGIRPTTINAGLRGDGGLLNNPNAFMIGLVVDIQENGDILLLGSDSFGPFGSAAFFVDSGNLQAYRFDSSPSLPTLATNVIGQRLAIIIDCQDQSSMDIYINGHSAPISFDPWSNFFGWTTLFLNGGRNYGSASNIFGCAWAKSGGHDAANDPSIEELMNKMKGDYNIS